MIRILMAFLFLLPAYGPSYAVVDTISYCVQGQKRITCVVDGDTLWLHGTKIRLKGFDTPEPQVKLCGGNRERALADKASGRLIELLNTNDWTIDYFGKGRNGRRLATISIKGRDVGDILIEEKLARSWPDGHEFWCN
ncbi:MAG: thermonuclease family protein [Hyphomicrobiales bacterium]